VTCYRGGLRSKISQAWLKEAGFECPRISGGYKAFRQYLMNELLRLSSHPMLVISGNTGSGKTLLLHETEKFRPTVNLERLARHRGSAFGASEEPQPSQSNYENQLTADLLKQENRKENLPLIIEDESRMIGSCVQPDKFFSALRQSEIILLNESLESRVETIFHEYILNIPIAKRSEAFLRYLKSIQIISKKLGGLRVQEVMNDLSCACVQSVEGELNKHKLWIEKLLVWYYDPLYLQSLTKRKPSVIFRGSRSEALEYLKSH
jgi:tRNA 2-selenouridine synthase